MLEIKQRRKISYQNILAFFVLLEKVSTVGGSNFGGQLVSTMLSATLAASILTCQ